MSLNIVQRLIPEWGTTYGPSGDGPFPAIMLLHGSEGAWSGWSHRNAVILAAQGFLAFPFGYSNGGNVWNAGSIIDCPLDRSVEALNALRQFAYSDTRIGLYGMSRGAEHALLLASLMARDEISGLPEAIAAHSPPDVICGGFDSTLFRDTGDPGWRAWDGSHRAWTWKGTSETLLPTTPIEVDRYPGPLFLSHGTADRMWSVEMTKRMEKRLKAHDRTPDVHYYDGEYHVLGIAAENIHQELLISFFERHLCGD
nr:acyl-CoA thioester hydrolase/BAAT C-terminal domain-containing protein [uncultured Halomonas sp.]